MQLTFVKSAKELKVTNNAFAKSMLVMNLIVNWFSFWPILFNVFETSCEPGSISLLSLSLSFSLSMIQNPSTPFEDALYAMQTENLDLLRNYLSCDHVSVNEADVSGNTLLHFAVAMGKIEIVRIVSNRWGQYVCVCGEGEEVFPVALSRHKHSFVTIKIVLPQK